MPAPLARLARRGALVAAGAALAGPLPAAAGMTVLYDRADTVERVVATRPGGGPGLTPADGLVQQQPARRVLPPGRQAWKVHGGDGTRATPSLLGRGPSGMAALLRDRIRRSGAHLVFLDELGWRFQGREGDDLAAALTILSRERAPYAPTGLARRVHVYLPHPGVILADVDKWIGVRRVLMRVGGVWLETYRGREQWAAEEWLTWPGEFARRMQAAGGSRSRVHVLLRGGGDHAGAWRNARTGTSCAVLAHGPGGYRLAGDADAFVAEFRAAFPAGPPDPKHPAVGCLDAVTLPAPAAAALDDAYRREASGVQIPPGGLTTPPLPAGEPAQITVQLGSDPLGLAEGLGRNPEATWTAMGIRLAASGPGFAAEATVDGDGSARLSFTPAAPGPVTMRLIVPGAGLRRALGGPVDVLSGLRAAGAHPELVRRVIASPAGWSLSLPVMLPGRPPGSPVLEIVAPPA